MRLRRKRGTTVDQYVIVEAAAQPYKEVSKISLLRNRWPAESIINVATEDTMLFLCSPTLNWPTRRSVWAIHHRRKNFKSFSVGSTDPSTRRINHFYQPTVDYNLEIWVIFFTLFCWHNVWTLRNLGTSGGVVNNCKDFQLEGKGILEVLTLSISFYVFWLASALFKLIFIIYLIVIFINRYSW